MIYLVLALFWALLVAVFAVQNAAPVEVRFLSWQVSVSVALLVIGATIAGAVFLGLLSLFRQVGMGLRLLDERARTQKATAELEQARLAAASLRKDHERLQEQNRRLAASVEELQAEVEALAGGQPAAGPAGEGEGGPDDRKPEG